MSTVDVLPSAAAAEAAAAPAPRPGRSGRRTGRYVSALARGLLALLATTGRPVVARLAELSSILAVALAVVLQSLRPLTWRRPVRAELVRQCLLSGLGNLKTVCALAVLVGIGLVYQVLYWLGLAGQRQFVGQFLALVLIREIAPLAVAVVLIGRSGAAVTAELAAFRGDGQVRALDALGLDPLHVLLIPRAVGMSICLFCLTVAFVAVAIASGYFCARALDVSQAGPAEFVVTVLGLIDLNVYLQVVLKTVLIGLLAGVICCRQGLNTAAPGQLTDAVSCGFGKSLLAAFLISGAITMFL